MRGSVEASWVLNVMLASARLAAFLWATPLFALSSIPARVKLIMVVVFGIALTSVSPATTVPLAASLGGLFQAMFAEIVVGALMGFGLLCSFAAFQFGGRLLDLQIGFGVASLINPGTNEQDPLLGTLLLYVGVMTFYLVDGHHWVVRSLLQSVEWFPLGQLPQNLNVATIVAHFGLMFSLGTMLVAPVVAVLLLLDAGLGMAAKTMPQLNVFMISIPIKIVVGLLTLAATAPYLRGVTERVLESSFNYWRSLVQ
jgi:flagellar biosynthetic protein FliR